jgi:hypothetical protein
MIDDRTRLRHGPYAMPPLHVGDCAVCELRGDGIITSISNGRIPWPRCRSVEAHGGGSGLLLAGDLVQAVRTEAAIAVQNLWGVTHGVLIRWRAALNVTRTNNKGTKRLRHAVARVAGAATQAHEWTEAERQARRRTAKRQDLHKHRSAGFRRAFGWKPEEIALLGTLPDEEVAAKIGRTATAVRVMRTRRGLPPRSIGDGVYNEGVPGVSDTRTSCSRLLPGDPLRCL